MQIQKAPDPLAATHLESELYQNPERPHELMCHGARSAAHGKYKASP